MTNSSERRNLAERRKGEDRRHGSIFNCSLPFLTKDGLVFHERRRQHRRAAILHNQQATLLNPA